MRMLEPDDVGEVKDLIDRTIDACYPCAYPPNAIAFFKEHHSENRILEDADRGYAIVLEDGGRIAATGTLVETHIKRVFVEPSMQGNGHGKAVMACLEHHARDNGIDTVDLDASLVSKRFYDVLGYKATEDASIDVGDGQTLDFFRMRKPLAPG